MQSFHRGFKHNPCAEKRFASTLPALKFILSTNGSWSLSSVSLPLSTTSAKNGAGCLQFHLLV
jgi:hypothetical protein